MTAAMPLLRITGAALVVAAGMSCPSDVIADVRPGLAIEGGVAISDNPLLLAGPNRGAVIAEAGIRPAIEISDMTGLTIALNGLLAGRHYSGSYDDLVHGNAQLSVDWRKNEWLTLSGLALFSREPLIDRVGTDIDASVNSIGVRESRLGRLSLMWNPDSHTRIRPELTVETGHYPGIATLSDTRATTLAITATRQTSARTTLGTRWTYSHNSVDFGSNSRVYSAYASLDQRLAEAWRLRAELGLERVRTAGFQPGSTDKRVQAAGRAEICRDSSRLNLCANASLASEVSGLGGLQRRVDIGATGQWRLKRRLSLTFEGRYQRATIRGANLPRLDGAQARISLDHRMNSRLTASAIAEYRRREVPGGRALSSAAVGIQLKYEPLPL